MNVQDQIEYAYDVVLKARNIEAFIEVRILDEHPDWEQYIIPLEDEWLECQDILLSDFIGENDVRTSEDFDDWFADKLYYQLLKPWIKLVNYRQTLSKNKAVDEEYTVPQMWHRLTDEYLTAINNFVKFTYSLNGWKV